MTKGDIINHISLMTGMERKEVTLVVEAFMEEVRNSLIERREAVYLRGFGSFLVKHRAAKTARNISKNTTIYLEPYDLPCFKPSKSFAERVKNTAM